MRSKLLWALVLGALGAAVYVGNILATPASGFTPTTIAMATFGDLNSVVHTSAWSEQLKTRGKSDLYVQQNAIQPGGSSGWHTHPGPSLIIVTEGSITAYEGDDPHCTPHVYTAGTPNNTFVDLGGGDVHIIRNETNAEAKDIAVQLVPAGAMRRQDIPVAPGNCPF